MQYLKTQSILFLYGLFDSIQFMKGIRRYAFDPKEKQCIEIQKYLKQATEFAGIKLAIVFLIDLFIYLLALLQIPKLILLLIQIIPVLLYIENNIRQLVYVGKITQTAIQYETNVKQNRQFFIYNLKRDNNVGFSTIIDQIKLTLQALLFSFLLLLQTSLFDILVVILPENTLISLIIKHVDYLLYAVYIQSIKIYNLFAILYFKFLNLNLLIYYSYLSKELLNIHQQLQQPDIYHQRFHIKIICLIIYIHIQDIQQVIQSSCHIFQIFISAFLNQEQYFLFYHQYIDAPLITEIEEKSFHENFDILIKNFLGEEGIPRTSYEHHLKLAENDTIYVYVRELTQKQEIYKIEIKLDVKKTIGWFTLARGLRPYVINPLNKAIIIFMKIYNSLLGIV